MKVQGEGTRESGHRNGEIIPLDEYLRIAGLPFKISPEMMAETAFWGTHECSFKSAAASVISLSFSCVFIGIPSLGIPEV